MPVFQLEEDEDVYFNDTAGSYQIVSGACMGQPPDKIGTPECPVIEEVSYAEVQQMAEAAAAGGEQQ